MSKIAPQTKPLAITPWNSTRHLNPVGDEVDRYCLRLNSKEYTADWVAGEVGSPRKSQEYSRCLGDGTPKIGASYEGARESIEITWKVPGRN